MAPQSIGLNRKRQVPAEDTPAFGAIAERFRRAGDLERAVALCQEGLLKFPDHLSARVTLGWSLLDLGRYDEARDALESALKRAPDNLAAIRGLAELHDRAEHTMTVPMDGPGQWPPDPSALDGLAFDPAASSAPADVPFKSEPLSLDGLLSGAKPKAKAKGKKGKDETQADELVDVVIPPVSSESRAIPDLVQSTSHRAHRTAEPAAEAVVAAGTDEVASIDLSAVLGEVAQAVPDLETEDTGVELSVDGEDANLEKALQVAQAAAEQAAADAAATRKAAEEQSATESRARRAAEDKAAEEAAARRAAEEKALAETAARKAAEDKAAAETAARKAAEQAAAEAAARHAAEQKAAAETAAKRAADEKAATEAASKKAAEEKAAAVAAATKAAEKVAAEAAAKRAAEQKAAAEAAAKKAAEEKAAAEAAAKQAAEERAAQAARDAAEQAAAEARARKAAEQKAAAEAAARKAAEEKAAAETAARQAAEKAAAEAARKAAEDRAAAEAAAKQAAEERAAMEAERRRAAEEKAEAEAAARLAAKTAAAEAEARRAAERRAAEEAAARAAAEEAAEHARQIEIRPVPATGKAIHALNGNDVYNGSINVAPPGAVLNLSTPDPGMSGGTRKVPARRALPELESLLRRVETRRAQLMTESVA